MEFFLSLRVFQRQNEARIDALEAVEHAFAALVCNPCDVPHAEVFSCLRARLLTSVRDEETLKIVVDCIFNQVSCVMPVFETSLHVNGL